MLFKNKKKVIKLIESNIHINFVKQYKALQDLFDFESFLSQYTQKIGLSDATKKYSPCSLYSSFYHLPPLLYFSSLFLHFYHYIFVSLILIIDLSASSSQNFNSAGYPLTG